MVAEELGRCMNLSAWVFSFYKHIIIYSLIAALCNSSQIHSETFSFACGFFPQGFST